MAAMDLFDKLHPAIKSDACDICFFAILKTVFDAENYEELSAEDAFEIIDLLSKQSKYEERANIFLGLEFRKKSKSNRIEALKEYYGFIKPKIMQVIEDTSSSLYCAGCLARTGENNGLFEWIGGPTLHDYKEGDKLCDNYAGLETIENVNIKGVDFIGRDSLDILVSRRSSDFTIEFNKSLGDLIPSGSAVKVKLPGFTSILKYWYKNVFEAKMPKITKETKLFSFTAESLVSKIKLVEISERDFLYDRGMLKKDAGPVAKEMRKEFSEKVKAMPIEEREAKTLTFFQEAGIQAIDYATLKSVYYPDMADDELLMMSMQDKLYNSALERATTDAKKGRLDLSCV